LFALWCLFPLLLSSVHSLAYSHPPTTTTGNILAERTDTAMGTKKSGSLSRKLQAAMKALGDFTVLTDWIKEQVDIDIENPALRPAEHEKYVSFVAA
jgi:hypothetical protein